MILKYDYLVGRPWDSSRNDSCFVLGRLFFKDNFGIEIPDYASPSNWWANPEWNLYEELSLESGFVKVDRNLSTAWPGDISLVCVNYPNPCHAVIHLSPGKILHHPIGQLSQAPPKMPLYVRNGYSSTLRHRGIPDYVAPEAETFDLMLALSPRKRAKYEAVLASLKPE